MPPTEPEIRIFTRVQEALSQPDAERVVERFIPLWTANYRLASEQVTKHAATLLFMVLFFTVVATASVADANVFGLKFQTSQVPLLLSYIVSGILYYRIVLLLAFSELIDSGIRGAHHQLFRELYDRRLTELAAYPSLLQVENALNNLEEFSTLYKRTAVWFSLTLSVALPLAAITWFTWGAYVLIANRLLPIPWAAGAIAVNAVLICRTLLAQAHSLSRV